MKSSLQWLISVLFSYIVTVILVLVICYNNYDSNTTNMYSKLIYISIKLTGQNPSHLIWFCILVVSMVYDATEWTNSIFLLLKFRIWRIIVTAEEAATDMSPDSGINELHGLTPEEQERQCQEWQQELVKVCNLIRSGSSSNNILCNTLT